jgi:hypothetical protein
VTTTPAGTASAPGGRVTPSAATSSKLVKS